MSTRTNRPTALGHGSAHTAPRHGHHPPLSIEQEQSDRAPGTWPQAAPCVAAGCRRPRTCLPAPGLVGIDKHHPAPPPPPGGPRARIDLGHCLPAPCPCPRGGRPLAAHPGGPSMDGRPSLRVDAVVGFGRAPAAAHPGGAAGRTVGGRARGRACLPAAAHPGQLPGGRACQLSAGRLPPSMRWAWTGGRAVMPGRRPCSVGDRAVPGRRVATGVTCDPGGRRPVATG